LSTFRILHVESSRGAGGQEIRTLLEAQIMSGRGHAVIIAVQPNSFLARQAQEMGLSIIAIRMNCLLSGLLLFSFNKEVSNLSCRNFKGKFERKSSRY